jgi:hypothetical protein
MHVALPTDITRGATLRGNEYGWNVASFPVALARAEAKGYACLGGQFQFRLDDGTTCEMYWLSADSNDRVPGEAWADYSHRSCAEVLNNFKNLASTTDFGKEASAWPSVQIEPIKTLVFVASFVTEGKLADLAERASARQPRQ